MKQAFYTRGLAFSLDQEPASEGAPVKAWFSIVARDLVHKMGAGTRNLNAEQTDLERGDVTWDDVVDSLTEWFSNPSSAPQLQKVHEDEGHSYGYATGEVRVLTGAELVERGADPALLPQGSRDVPQFLAEYALTDPDVIARYERGQIRTVSPWVHVGFVDDAGRTWPIAALETSLTANPVQKTHQASAAALRGVTLAAQAATPKEPAMDPEDIKQMIADAIKPVVERLDAVERELTEPTPPPGAQLAEIEDEEAAEKIAELEAKVEELEEEIVKTEAAAQLADLPITEEERKDLVKLRIEAGQDAFALALRYMPAAPQRQTMRLSASPTRDPNATPSTPAPVDEDAFHWLASDYAVANSISYREARKAVRLSLTQGA